MTRSRTKETVVSICIRPINSFNLSRTIISPEHVGVGDSSVDIVTKLWAGGPGFDSWQGYSAVFRPALEPTYPPMQWVPGTLSPWVKRPRCEAGHSPPSGAQVKNGVAIPPLPQYVFMAQGQLYKCFINHDHRMHRFLTQNVKTAGNKCESTYTIHVFQSRFGRGGRGCW
jgi:hypothetical protein